MSEKEKEKKEKICPLTTNSGKPVKCHRENCALWIQIKKLLTNPCLELHYEGCGLIAKVPWELTKEEDLKE